MVGYLTVIDQWGHGARIFPLFNLRMTISEREATRVRMVKSGKVIKTVEPWIRSCFRVTIHLRAKVTGIHAIRTHVEEDKQLGYGHWSKIGFLPKKLPIVLPFPAAVGATEPA